LAGQAQQAVYKLKRHLLKFHNITVSHTLELFDKPVHTLELFDKLVHT